MSLSETKPSSARAGRSPAHLDGAANEDAVELPLRRLDGFHPLERVDRDLVLGSLGAWSEHRAGADLGDDGDQSCRLLVSGWACRVSETAWGGRQILDFVLPGDAIGLSVRPRLEGLYRIITLNRGATIDARTIRDRLRAGGGSFLGLNRACQREELATARRMVGHTTRLGGVSASQAMAHLLLELRERLAQVDLLAGPRFPMPLSQENLHQALGITSTQVYRILSQLRKDGLILLGPGWAEIPDPSALAAAAGLKRAPLSELGL